MKKIWNFIVNLPKDKILHFTMCLIITLTASVIFKQFGFDKIMVFALGWAVGFAFGIGKEIYDEVKSESSDSADWVMDIIGSTLGALLILLS